MFVDCRYKRCILFYITHCNIHLSFLRNYQRFSKQWYDQAAQPQNMTFSQRKSGAEKFPDNYNFSINFYFTFLSKLRKLFGETYNFEDILSFL